MRALLLFDSGPGFKNREAQAGWEAQVGRIADRLEMIGFEGYVDGRASSTAIGRRPDLAAAQAAGRAIQAQNPHGVARFGRRVVAGTVNTVGSVDLSAASTVNISLTNLRLGTVTHAFNSTTSNAPAAAPTKSAAKHPAAGLRPSPTTRATTGNW